LLVYLGVNSLNWAIVIALWLVTLAAAVGGGYQLRRMTTEAALGSAEAEAKRIIDAAAKEAEASKREALVEAREEVHRLRAEWENEVREQRAEAQRIEKRLLQREESLDRRSEQITERESGLRDREEDLNRQREAIEELKGRELAELERISGLKREEAREVLLAGVRDESRREATQLSRQIEDEARSDAEKRAKEIIGMAIQRCAADHTAESTVSVVALPSDDMKGRIIGREGRNIRAFEALTGVDLIIDDTPEAVVISAFDPVRREKARLTLQKLIVDGRIHPARIEEMYQKAEREVDELIREEGEKAAYEAGVSGMHAELVRILGRLKYRTSYGQNVLKHSIEVAHLAALMATQLEVNVAVARRAGLVHDIGKAMDHEVEGTHVMIGMDLLKRYHESDEVIHAMSTHHGDFEAHSVEAVLVTAADALSASRPGARRETLEAYIQRLHKLEEIADSFDGVEKSYAISAGREIRIVVKPEQVDDLEAYRVAKEVCRRIEDEMRYPGQIKVTVIRETRHIEYAR
jgi:ribonuclease Y